MLHHETYGCTGLAATEALEYALGWRYDERRGLLVMERAACLIGGSCPLQGHEVTDDIFDLG
jgi:hypothetical protein